MIEKIYRVSFELGHGFEIVGKVEANDVHDALERAEALLAVNYPQFKDTVATNAAEIFEVEA